MWLSSTLVGMNSINKDFAGKDSHGPPSSAKLLTYDFEPSTIKIN